MATRLYGNPRECPVPACSRTVRAGQLMCGPHWHQVPSGAQRDVYRTWRTWNTTHDDGDWTAYLVARETALDAVEAANR